MIAQLLHEARVLEDSLMEKITTAATAEIFEQFRRIVANCLGIRGGLLTGLQDINFLPRPVKTFVHQEFLHRAEDCAFAVRIVQKDWSMVLWLKQGQRSGHVGRECCL